MQDTPKVISWKVIKWKQLWRKLGFPTANISLGEDSAILKDGTYKMNILIDKNIYSWMWNVSLEKKLCEVHIFDFTWDIYGQEIEVILLQKIRNNIKFDSQDDLIHQITQDMEKIRNISWKVLTFGTFDYLHPWHISYLQQARTYADHLITIVALDSTVEKVKWAAPVHHQDQRLEALQQLQDPWLSNHTVVLWDQENVYQCLHDRSPQVIFLWYDQQSFDTGILEYCKNNNLQTPLIIRGQSFKPGVYKSSLMRVR